MSFFNSLGNKFWGKSWKLTGLSHLLIEFVPTAENLESVDVKNHVETENECRDEAVIETVVDAVVQNMISKTEIEKDRADMMKLNQKKHQQNRQKLLRPKNR